MTMKAMIWSLALTAMGASAAHAIDLPKFDPSKYSQKVTGCDLLAGHPNDPHKNVVGLEKRDMDLPAAIAACKVAVERDPTNPRLNYQLGRVLGYSGKGDQAYKYREVALAAGYPQAVMVYGFMHLNGQNFAKVDKCLSGELHQRAARDGLAPERFVWWVLEGAFDGCPGVKVDYQELLKYLDEVDKKTGDAYVHSINDNMRKRIKAKLGK